MWVKPCSQAPLSISVLSAKWHAMLQSGGTGLSIRCDYCYCHYYYRTHTSISDPSSQIRIISPYLLEVCVCVHAWILYMYMYVHVYVYKMYMYCMYIQCTSYPVWHWLEFKERNTMLEQIPRYYKYAVGQPWLSYCLLKCPMCSLSGTLFLR